MAAAPQTERLCRLEDVPDGGALGLEARVQGAVEPLLLLRAGDEIRCFLNVCPHAGRRLDWAPDRFIVDAGTVVCAAHGATFTIPTGECVAGPCRGQVLHEVPVHVDGAEVFVT